MPNDQSIGYLPDVSMGCTVVDALLGNPIVNVAPPDPLADLGPMQETSPGTWYASSPPYFVGAMPMRTELSILPTPEDYNPGVPIQPHEDSFVVRESDLRSGSTGVSGSIGSPGFPGSIGHQGNDGQVLVSNGTARSGVPLLVTYMLTPTVECFT